MNDTHEHSDPQIDFDGFVWETLPQREICGWSGLFDETSELGYIDDDSPLSGQPTLYTLQITIQTIVAQTDLNTIGKIAEFLNLPAERCWQAVGLAGWIYTIADGAPIEDRVILHEGV